MFIWSISLKNLICKEHFYGFLALNTFIGIINKLTVMYIILEKMNVLVYSPLNSFSAIYLFFLFFFRQNLLVEQLFDWFNSTFYLQLTNFSLKSFKNKFYDAEIPRTFFSDKIDWVYVKLSLEFKIKLTAFYNLKRCIYFYVNLTGKVNKHLRQMSFEATIQSSRQLLFSKVCETFESSKLINFSFFIQQGLLIERAQSFSVN